MEIEGIDKLAIYARDLIQEIHDAPHGTVVVGLYGDLGAGKTTLVQTIARELGITVPVTSPTFVIRKAYEVPNDMRFKTLVHIDAYRMEHADEMKTIDFESDLNKEDAVIFIECADRVEDALPENTKKLFITITEGETRDIQDGSN